MNDAFIAAIVAEPGDDLPRLIFADHLEESGEPANVARAEFIRVQVELAGVKCEWEGTPVSCQRYSQKCEPCKRMPALRERENWLFAANADAWFPVPNGYGLDWEINLERHQRTEAQRPGTYLISRGFISRVSCTLSAFIGGECPRCDHGRDSNGNWIASTESRTGGTCPTCNGTGHTVGIAGVVAASQPVTEWNISDVTPMEVHLGDPEIIAQFGRLAGVNDVGTAGEWYFREFRDFCGENTHNIPIVLFALLEGQKIYPGDEHLAFYPTSEAAMQALSAACIAYAKQQAAKLTRTPDFTSLGVG